MGLLAFTIGALSPILAMMIYYKVSDIKESFDERVRLLRDLKRKVNTLTDEVDSLKRALDRKDTEVKYLNQAMIELRRDVHV